MAITQTAIGRVIPTYQGAWDSSKTYVKLDNVLCEGSTYIAVKDVPAGNNPTTPNSQYWKMIASKGDSIKGDTGSFGTPIATAVGLEYGEEPTAQVTASGPDDAKIFQFDFGLPAGPLGFDIDDIRASITSTADPISVVAAIDSGKLGFEFNIPPASGTGIKSLDNSVFADGSGNADYNGVRAIENQGLSLLQQRYARENINAQIAGNYQPAGNYIADPSASTGQFLQFDNNGEWIGTNINLVPSGNSEDIGKYLRKSSTGMIWADVQSLPSGGAEGAPLIKNSVDNFDVTWGSIITTSDIDTIISGT